eukprot:403359525
MSQEQQKLNFYEPKFASQQNTLSFATPSAQKQMSFNLKNHNQLSQEEKTNSYKENRRLLNRSQDHRQQNNSNIGDYQAQISSQPNIKDQLAQPSQENVIYHNESLKNYIGRVYAKNGTQKPTVHQMYQELARNHNLNQIGFKSNPNILLGLASNGKQIGQFQKSQMSKQESGSNQKLSKLLQIKDYISELEQFSPKSQQTNSKMYQALDNDTQISNNQFGVKQRPMTNNQTSGLRAKRQNIQREINPQINNQSINNLQNSNINGYSQQNYRMQTATQYSLRQNFTGQDHKQRQSNSLINQFKQSKGSMDYQEIANNDNFSNVFNSPVKSMTAFNTTFNNAVNTPSQQLQKEMILELNIKDIKANLDKLPSQITNLKELENELELQQFGMFLGQKDIFEVPELKISAPKYLCSLFQDINELFTKIIKNSEDQEKPDDIQFLTEVVSISTGRSNYEKINQERIYSQSQSDINIVDEEFIEIQRKYRRLVSYFSNNTGFINGLSLDILWKSQFLKFDQIIHKIKKFYQDKQKDLEQQVITMNFEKSTFLGLLDKQRIELCHTFDEEIKQLNNQNRDMKESKLQLETNLEELRNELEKLTRFEKRKGAISEVEETYDNIAGFLGKVQIEQKRTVLTLRKLEALMGAERGSFDHQEIGEDYKYMSEVETERMCDEIFDLYTELDKTMSDSKVQFDDIVLRHFIDKQSLNYHSDNTLNPKFQLMKKILRYSDQNMLNVFETDKNLNKKGLIYNVLKQRDQFLTLMRRIGVELKVNQSPDKRNTLKRSGTKAAPIDEAQFQSLSTIMQCFNLFFKDNSTIVQNSLSQYIEDYQQMSKLLIKSQIVGFKHCVNPRDIETFYNQIGIPEQDSKSLIAKLENSLFDQLNFILIQIAACNKHGEIQQRFQEEDLLLPANIDTNKITTAPLKGRILSSKPAYTGQVSQETFKETLQNFGFLSTFQIEILLKVYNPHSNPRINYKQFLDHISSKDIMKTADQVYVRLDQIALYFFNSYEAIEKRRIDMIEENYKTTFKSVFDQQTKLNMDFSQPQDFKIDFNMDEFSSFLDQLMPDLGIDLKYELFLPISMNLMNDFAYPFSLDKSFNNFISSAFDVMDVHTYGDSVLYNPRLMKPDEIISTITEQTQEQTLMEFMTANGLNSDKKEDTRQGKRSKPKQVKIEAKKYDGALKEQPKLIQMRDSASKKIDQMQKKRQ